MTGEKYIVDRIEESFIILENRNRKIFIIDKSNFERVPKEGDILIKEGNKYKIDVNLTKKRKLEIDEKMKWMWIE